MASNGQRIDLRLLKKGPSEWELLEVIGEGTYGSVYRGKNKHSGRFGAIKIIENVLSKAEEVQVELNIFRKHSAHPNIADFYGAYINENLRGLTQLWIVLEYCDGGSVSDLVKRLIAYGSRLDESIISLILYETLQGIKHLHDNLVIHRDIKGPNILLTNDAQVKLIDFGVSAELAYTTVRRHSSVGTPFWMAPEVIACEQQLEYTYDARCDVWSLGITAIELADGEPPLADQHPMRALFKIPRNPPPTVKRPDKWSSDYLDFIGSCLVKDFEQRPSISSVLQHTFVANVVGRDQLKYPATMLDNGAPTIRLITIRQQLVTLLSSQIRNERKSVKEVRKMQGSNEKVLSRDVRQAYALFEIDDLATLETLNDEIIMRHLYERYVGHQIYTYIGDILIAVNPFKEMGIYGPSTAKLYQHEQKSDLPPHIFMIACSAYQSMMHKLKDQCCVISGESGAGKTVSSNYIIQHLAEIGDGGNHSLVSKILQVNPLMEAFGNAQTVINNNSSRFGKYLELHFNEFGALMGAQLSEYLLEKSRVVSQARGERNFHILYYLIAGLDYHRKLGHFDLSTSDKHRYLNTDDMTLDEFACTQEMQARFNVVQRSFDKIGFTQEEVQSLYCILAAVIHIGDIEFVPDEEAMHQGEKSKVLNPDTLKTVSSLLCIKSNELRDGLTTNSSVTRGETITRNNTVEQAIDCRDATAKALYGRLFSWIVKRVNSLLRFDDGLSKTAHKIGILDIFGFENFKQNSFEQLCINIANEQIQFYFNQHVFEWEFEEYLSEGISAESIVFENNRTILDLFLQKPMGMLALLDEESRFPKATDVTLVEKFADNLSPLHFTKPKDSSTTFLISHFAGKVTYDATSFLEKNRDTLSADILQVLRISDDKLVRTLFQGILDSQGRLLSLPDSKGNGIQPQKMGGTNSANSFFLNTSVNTLSADGKSYTSFMATNRLQYTVSTHFRNSLRNLLSKMIHADPHFVRCVRPNNNNVADRFDEEKVLTQLRYTGVLETTKIRRQGFSHRILFADFVSRYKFLISPIFREIHKDSSTCRKILSAANLDASWRIGRTKVFLKYYHVEKLSRLLEAFRRKVIMIQRNVRYYIARRKAEKMRVKREAAAIVIQTAFRGYLARCELARLKDAKNKQEQGAIVIQADATASAEDEAFRGYNTRKRIKDEKAKKEEERANNAKDISMTFLDQNKNIIGLDVSHGRIHRKQETEVFSTEEEQESVEETRIIYFLAQIRMAMDEVHPLLARTSYPVLYSLRKESDKAARKYRGTMTSDPREKILSVVDGVDDTSEERIRWAREKFENIAELSRRSPLSPRRSRGLSVLNETGRPDDPFHPGAHRVRAAFDRTMSTENPQTEALNEPKEQTKNVERFERMPQLPDIKESPLAPRSNKIELGPRLSNENVVKKMSRPIGHPNGAREGREYPSRLAYERNGHVPSSRDEFHVTDFEWFIERKKQSIVEPFVSPALTRRPMREDFPLRPNVYVPEPHQPRKTTSATGYPVHYRPYNYLTGNEVDSKNILPSKPQPPPTTSSSYDLLGGSSAKSMEPKRVLPAKPSYMENNGISHHPRWEDRINSPPLSRPRAPTTNGSAVPLQQRASVNNSEALKRPASGDSKPEQRHKISKDHAKFPPALVKKFPTPKERGQPSERMRNIYGFSYGLSNADDGNLKEFQLRKTGRLQQLVPS